MNRSFHIYYTSDTHGHIFPVDYASDSKEKAGLLNMAYQVEKDGDTLIIDGEIPCRGRRLYSIILHIGKKDINTLWQLRSML